MGISIKDWQATRHNPELGIMVQAMLKSIPDDWEAAVAMDFSGGFWDKMVKRYRNIEIL